MKTAIVLHGMPEKDEYYNPQSLASSHKHWVPWIQRQLLLHDILAQTPELPRPYEPNYANWKQVFEQFRVDKDSILIGHSCGAGFLVRWLSENDVKICQLVLVAPWINPGNGDTHLVSDFFDFEIDPAVQERVGEIIIFSSDNDMADCIRSAEILHEKWPKSQLITLPGKGHFCASDLGSDAFPELLAVLKK